MTRRGAEPEQPVHMPVCQMLELAAALGLCRGQRQRIQDAGLGEVIEGFAGDRFDHQSDQDVVRVGIGIVLAGDTLWRIAGHEPDQVSVGEARRAAQAAGKEETDILQIVRNAGRVVEQHAQGQALMVAQPVPPVLTGQLVIKWRVERQDAFIHQLDCQQGRDGLAGTAGQKACVRIDRRMILPAGLAAKYLYALAIRQDGGDGQAGRLAGFDRVIDGGLQR